jgi:hypothetical protein
MANFLSSLFGGGNTSGDVSGGGGGLGDLFQNKLFLQYLAGAGQDIGSGNPLGTNVNAVTNQNIQTQNFAGLLQHMLGGGVPGGKVVADDKGVKFDVPKSALSQDIPNLNDQDGTKATGSVTPTQNPTSNVNPNLGQQNLLRSLLLGGGIGTTNPFVTDMPKMTPSDLAGLTPQNIALAFQVKQAQDEMNIKALSGAKEKLPVDQQNYLLAKQEGFKGSFIDFKDAAKTIHQKDYEAARSSGYGGSFQQWLMDMRKAGAGSTTVNLTTKLAEKKAFGDLKGQLYFADPEWVDDVNKYMSSPTIQDSLFTSKNPTQTRSEEKVKYIEDKIVAGGGSIEDVKLDGRMMEWKVKWPSGDTKTIRQPVK